MHSFIRNVGNKSNRQDLVGDLLIILSDLSKHYLYIIIHLQAKYLPTTVA